MQWMAPGAAGCRRGDVVGVGGAGRTEDLADDRGAASDRGVPLLEDEHGGTLAHHEPVARRVEGMLTPARSTARSCC